MPAEPVGKAGSAVPQDDPVVRAPCLTIYSGYYQQVIPRLQIGSEKRLVQMKLVAGKLGDPMEVNFGLLGLALSCLLKGSEIGAIWEIQTVWALL
jgi:hypothetical protein